MNRGKQLQMIRYAKCPTLMLVLLCVMWQLAEAQGQWTTNGETFIPNIGNVSTGATSQSALLMEFRDQGAGTALPIPAVSALISIRSQSVFYDKDKALREPLQAEVLILSRRGFNKSVINRPKGRFILHVEDRSGLDNIDIELKKAEDGSVLNKWLEQHNKKRKGVVSLPPGEYLLSVVDHPEWVCRVTITAN